MFLGINYVGESSSDIASAEFGNTVLSSAE
jgi:hypothetical protein